MARAIFCLFVPSPNSGLTTLNLRDPSDWIFTVRPTMPLPSRGRHAEAAISASPSISAICELIWLVWFGSSPHNTFGVVTPAPSPSDLCKSPMPEISSANKTRRPKLPR